MGSQVERVLKRDGLGRVELLTTSTGPRVRRVAAGGRLPGSRFVARLLLERERRALRRLDGVPGVARLEAGGSAPDELLRSWISGHPLHETPTLPRDFFDRLRELVEAIHGRGVCHNDLHKEQNVLVDERGFPALVDFQLASVHERRNRRYRVRCAEDLRHVEKTRRRYARRGAKSPPEGPRSRRSALAWAWLRIGKPIYNVAAGALGGRDREPRRPSSGPWPEWTEPVGRRMS